MAFATDIPEAEDPRIVAWFHGHTKKAAAVQGRFYCNPVGEEGNDASDAKTVRVWRSNKRQTFVWRSLGCAVRHDRVFRGFPQAV